MNEAVRVATDGLLTNARLAALPDFSLGLATVSPSSRTVSGPGGIADVEPRVMQVLVALAEASGHVVTRETLLQRCWGDVFVADDSLNRAIRAVRKLAVDIADESFEIETLRGTGYRLTDSHDVKSAAPALEAAPRPLISRRTLIGSAAATAAVLGGGGLWLLNRPHKDPRAEKLLERGSEALRLDQPGSEQYFQHAIALEPGNGKAWGLLAYALANMRTSSARSRGDAAQSAERAARSALQIDPDEPNANLAMTIVQPLDWFSREERFWRILAADPNNTFAMRNLGQMLHGVGRCRAALAISERAIAIEPLAPDHQLRRALRLWVIGRVADADQVIDRAVELWPSHPLVRLARIMIYAFTGRPQAALAVVDDESKHRNLLSPSVVSIWRKSLVAIDTRAQARIAEARTAIVDGAKGSPAVAAWGILALSALGQADAAFEVADGMLLGRGPIIVRQDVQPEDPRVRGWRNTYGLFTPATKAMRLDPRFRPLCDGLGLTEYWRKRAIGPDPFLFQA